MTTPTPRIPLNEHSDHSRVRDVCLDCGVEVEREAQAIPLIDVELLTRALSRSEWNEQVSPPAAMWGYRGWAERIIARLARLASESSTADLPRHRNAAGVEFVTVACPVCKFTHAHRAALPVKEGGQ